MCALNFLSRIAKKITKKFGRSSTIKTKKKNYSNFQKALSEENKINKLSAQNRQSNSNFLFMKSNFRKLTTPI